MDDIDYFLNEVKNATNEALTLIDDVELSRKDIDDAISEANSIKHFYHKQLKDIDALLVKLLLKRGNSNE